MKYVNSGSLKLPYITMLAILSISLVVNLPGLAISPIEGRLHEIFPNVSDLQIQLLEVLPNFVVIPFILLSGKICTPKNQIFILGLGLVLYTVTGVLYFFANTMAELILLGCILGVGCGLVIPLAASLISQYFRGSERAKTLGMKSGLSNVTVIFATMFVGWIAEISWHLSFIVYMIPIIPLCLIPFLSPKFVNKYSTPLPANEVLPDPEPTSATGSKDGNMVVKKFGAFTLSVSRPVWLLFGIIGLYIAITYGSMLVSYYLPFTMQHYRLDSGNVGFATAMFYLAASSAGFALPRVKKLLGTYTMQAAILMMVLGLYATAVFHWDATFVIATFIIGFGYGIMQPIIYDKTTAVAPDAAASTRYFAYLLTGNYIGIAIVPFVVTAMARFFHAEHSVNFAYILNGTVMVALLLIAFFNRKSFVFKLLKQEGTKKSA